MTFYVLISRQLLSPRLPGPRGPLGVRNTKSKASTFRASHFQRSPRPAYINFVPADFFYFAGKGQSTRSLLLPEDRFYGLPVVAYQSVGCFVPRLIKYVLCAVKYVFIVHRGVRQEMKFIRLSHDGVNLDVDHDISTAILLVVIRQ